MTDYQRFMYEGGEEALERSLANPHCDSLQLESIGLQEWFELGAKEDGKMLLDPAQAKSVQWLPDKGWVKRSG